MRTEATVNTGDTIDIPFGAPFTPPELIPDWVLQFTLPSRYCEFDLAEAIVAGYQPRYDRIEAIWAWIHRHIEYQYGSSDASTSAVEIVRHCQGVCQDFAHLGIALCRALNIPARMVVGYLYE